MTHNALQPKSQFLAANLSWLAIIFLFASMGCSSYQFGFKGRSIPGGYSDVAIPVFKNVTAETGAEVFFTNAIINEFERFRLAKVTPQSIAQVTLEGEVASLAFDSTNIVTSGGLSIPGGTVLTAEYRATAKARLKLRRNSDQKVLWEGTVEGERPYTAPKIGIVSLNSANSLYNHSAQYQVIEQLAADMMAEAHNRLTENF